VGTSAFSASLIDQPWRRAMAKYKLVNTLNLGDVLVQTLIWLLLVLFTFGLALPFFAYYFLRLIINKTEIHEIP
jgi:hypothetical protein